MRVITFSRKYLTHWGRVTHICVGELTSIDSDNGLSPERRQAIIWTNDGVLLIGPLGTNFSEILIKIQTFSLKKIRLKMSSAKCCSFRLGLNVLSKTMLIKAVPRDQDGFAVAKYLTKNVCQRHGHYNAHIQKLISPREDIKTKGCLRICISIETRSFTSFMLYVKLN